jgi:hypothetical protein
MTGRRWFFIWAVLVVLNVVYSELHPAPRDTSLLMEFAELGFTLALLLVITRGPGAATSLAWMKPGRRMLVWGLFVVSTLAFIYILAMDMEAGMVHFPRPLPMRVLSWIKTLSAIAGLLVLLGGETDDAPAAVSESLKS